MENSAEADSDLAQSEPWTMLEDSDIEVCDEPSKTKEVEAPSKDEPKLSEVSQVEEEDDYAKLRRHRKFVEELERTEDLSWDPSNITIGAANAKVAEPPIETKAVCARCSICSVLLTKGGSKLASYLCNTFLALCVLAVASATAYYFQFPDHLNASNMKSVLAKYNHPDYAPRYDRYIEPKYGKNKNQMYRNDANNNHQKYEDTTRKQENKYYAKHDDYAQKKYRNRKDDEEFIEKRPSNKYDFDEKRYYKKKIEKKGHKQEHKEFNQRKNSKSKGDYKRK